jgi:hypothetical protein
MELHEEERLLNAAASHHLLAKNTISPLVLPARLWREECPTAAPGATATATPPGPDLDKIEEQISRRTLASKDAMERVIRYESHLHRLWVQTHHELEALQARRRGDRPSPLARLDVSGSPV